MSYYLPSEIIQKLALFNVKVTCSTTDIEIPSNARWLLDDVADKDELETKLSLVNITITTYTMTSKLIDMPISLSKRNLFRQMKHHMIERDSDFEFDMNDDNLVRLFLYEPGELDTFTIYLGPKPTDEGAEYIFTIRDHMLAIIDGILGYFDKVNTLLTEYDRSSQSF